MTDRVMQGLKPPPSSRRELKRVLRDLKGEPELTADQVDAFEKQVEQIFPGGFDQRDEANAIIAMAVRNGPLENLHAGQSSPLLNDDTLSRLTDSEIKAIMVYATRTVAMMLSMRDESPEAYRRYVGIAGHGSVRSDRVYPYFRKLNFARPTMTPKTPIHSLHPAYFDTHFEREESWDDWQAAFAIITA